MGHLIGDRQRRWRFGIGLGLGLLSVAAPGWSLDVRPGLWEQTVTTDLGAAGMPSIPPEALAKLPAEQRARLQALTAGGPQSKTTQVCLTAEQLARQDKDPFSGLDSANLQCTRDLKVNTPRQMQARVVCTGKNAMTAEGSYEAPNDTSMSGNTLVTRQQDGRDMTMKISFKGRWVGTDCGSVAPDRAPSR